MANSKWGNIVFYKTKEGKLRWFDPDKAKTPEGKAKILAIRTKRQQKDIAPTVIQRVGEAKIQQNKKLMDKDGPLYNPNSTKGREYRNNVARLQNIKEEAERQARNNEFFPNKLDEPSTYRDRLNLTRAKQKIEKNKKYQKDKAAKDAIKNANADTDMLDLLKKVNPREYEYAKEDGNLKNLKVQDIVDSYNVHKNWKNGESAWTKNAKWDGLNDTVTRDAIIDVANKVRGVKRTETKKKTDDLETLKSVYNNEQNGQYANSNQLYDDLAGSLGVDNEVAKKMYKNYEKKFSTGTKQKATNSLKVEAKNIEGKTAITDKDREVFNKQLAKQSPKQESKAIDDVDGGVIAAEKARKKALKEAKQGDVFIDKDGNEWVHLKTFSKKRLDGETEAYMARKEDAGSDLNAAIKNEYGVRISSSDISGWKKKESTNKVESNKITTSPKAKDSLKTTEKKVNVKRDYGVEGMSQEEEDKIAKEHGLEPRKEWIKKYGHLYDKEGLYNADNAYDSRFYITTNMMTKGEKRMLDKEDEGMQIYAKKVRRSRKEAWID